MKVSTIGLDIAKNVFQLVGLDKHGKEVLKKRLRRSQVLEYFAKLEACVVGVETCSGAHYWAEQLERLGHQVKLMSARAVKAYRSKTKNDYNDARAIAEAATREQVRAIAHKSAGQLEAQALHSARELVKSQRNQVTNSLRGLLAERGVVIAKSLKALGERVPEVLEDAQNGFGDGFREVLADLYERFRDLQARLGQYDRRVARLQAQDEQALLAARTPGIGVLTSTAVGAKHGDLSQFRRAEDFPAALGLVPRQDSTGGRTKLLGINKHTDAYLRTLLIHGARSVLSHAHKTPHDPLCRWALAVAARRGQKVAAVALANKLARITWAVVRSGQPYDPNKLRPRAA